MEGKELVMYRPRRERETEQLHGEQDKERIEYQEHVEKLWEFSRQLQRRSEEVPVRS